MNGVFVLSVTAVVMAVLYVAERLWPARRAPVEWGHNIIAYVLTDFGQIVRFTAPAALTAALVNGLGGGLVDLTRMPFLAGALIWLVAMDLAEYVFHRAQHAFPWLWAMHSLHHSDRGLNFLTTQRHFWLEPSLKAVSVWLAVALVFKGDAQIYGFYALTQIWHYVVHANLRLDFGPLSWVVNGPAYHRLHHSRDPAHYNSNYAALLPIFDVLTGAYRPPAPGERPETGLDVAVRSPMDVLVWPLRGLRRVPAIVGRGS